MDCSIHRQQEHHVLFLCLLNHFPCKVHLISLQQGIAHAVTHGFQERICHAAANHNGVRLIQQILNHADFVGNLGAAQNGHERPFGIFQSLAHDGQLFFHQQTCISGQICRHARSGRMGSMYRTECVGHIDICQRCQLLGKFGVVLLLALFKAQVLQQQNLTGLQRSSLCLCVFPHNVLCENHRLAQQLAQALCHGSQSQAFFPLSLGFAQMGAGNHSRAVVQQILNRGQRGNNALVAGNLSGGFVLGHVKVAAQQYFLARKVHITYRFLIIIHGSYSSLMEPKSFKPGNSCCRNAS